MSEDVESRAVELDIKGKKRVFDVDDASFFFGREALVQWLLNRGKNTRD